MEIHALEWKPEDASLQENQKRESIRRAVHEFLPPSGTFSRLPPHPPQATTSKGPLQNYADESKEKDQLRRQESVMDSRVSFLPQSSVEGSTAIPGTVSQPQKSITRTSLSAVATTKPPPVRQDEALRPFSSSSTTDIFFPRKGKTSKLEELEEGRTLETTSSTRFAYVK